MSLERSSGLFCFLTFLARLYRNARWFRGNRGLWWRHVLLNRDRLPIAKWQSSDHALLFSNRLEQTPEAVPYMLQAFEFSLEEPKRAVLAGDPSQARPLLRAIHSVYQPNKVVLGNTGPVEAFAKTLPAKDGPVVYLCTGTACQPPTKDAARVKELLK